MKNRVPPSMFRRSTLCHLITALAAASSFSASSATVAQTAKLDEVVVTGSRLQRDPNALSSQPVSTINRDAFTNVATTDIVEVLNDNPALLSSVSSANSIDSAAQNVGAASNVGGSTLDLRGMGYERTLTLVNGRRHVAGIEGTSAVDVSTIPAALIERVEVLTGGASAVYGADAVTGVVNFVLKENFEGAELDIRPSISARGDAETLNMSGLFGRNFAEGRGNVVMALQYDHSAGLRAGDRPFTRNNGLYANDVNPALRFQQGDINPATMPNLAQYYNFDNTGLFQYGLRIPTVDAFNNSFAGEFGGAPNLTPEELALFERAATAPPRALLPGRTFNITSPYGVVALGDFGIGATPLGSEPDLNGNGIPDCLESFTGYNSSLAGADSFGAAGGCWVIDEFGQLGTYQDGLVAGNFNQFGAEQSYIAPNRPYIIPKEDKWGINLNGTYDISPTMTVFGESKYVYHKVTFGGAGFQATDLLYGAPDNPFLPSELAPFANNDGVGFVGPGGLYISRDSDDWSSGLSTNTRQTMRFVGGVRGELGNTGLNYELSGNYGRFDREMIQRDRPITDRFFAAIDVVTDPATGEPVCRSDLDPTAYPFTTPFNFPNFLGDGARSGFFTFTPGQGQCQPANIWGGRGAISQEAIDFFTYDRRVEETIEQAVFDAFISGDSSAFFELPAGPVAFAVGGEWREERSTQRFDNFAQGILPVAGVTPDGTPFEAGQWVGDVSNARSLGNTPGNRVLSGTASYNVWDLFAEVEVPIIAGAFLAEELTLDAAFRYSNYSTFGGVETFKFGGLWAPIEDVRIRAHYSEAVRVPNLYELFSPEQGQNFRPADPCDAAQISSAPNAALRQANCVASLQSFNVEQSNIFDSQGNYIFVDPLSAGFQGVVGGNQDLEPETAITNTVGIVIAPRFIDGLTVSVDWWDIEIKDAISNVSAQNIVDNCYDAPSINNPFCDLLARNATSTSAQSGGFTFLRQTLLNFGAAEAAGIDTAINYRFGIGQAAINLGAVITKQNKLVFTQPTNPGEPDVIDIELGEMRRPEWSGQVNATVMYGPASVTWRTQYLGGQTLAYESGVEIETAMQNFGPAAFVGSFMHHNLSATWDYNNSMRLYGGISNVTNERPFVTERGYPVSAVGRAYFAGLNYSF